MKWSAAILIAAALVVGGCQSLSYYTQAIGGHLRVMASARPVSDWLADPDIDPQLRQRLQTAQRIREFASRELGLPDNASYASYADLNRSAVVWNVFAAPQFSVEPKSECFPFTGCVSYRGFYSEEEARRHADRLRADGLDVYMGGVPAYSTLGWFDDPLLSTFIRYPDAQLARLLFHELSHQLAYAKGDTTFNESFAVTVEEEGVKRWLEAQGRAGELASFRAQQARQREFAERVSQARQRLAMIYKSNVPPEAKLEQKRGEWARLRMSYPGIPAEPNNAFLASIATYTDLVPAFERLLAESGGDLRSFYKRVQALARKDAEREAFARSAGYRRSS